MKIIINLVTLPEKMADAKKELDAQGGPAGLAEFLERDFITHLSPFIDVDKSGVTVEAPEFE